MDMFYVTLLFFIVVAFLYVIFNYRLSGMVETRFQRFRKDLLQQDINEFYREMEQYSALIESRIGRLKKLVERQEAAVKRYHEIGETLAKSRKGKQINEFINKSLENEQKMISLLSRKSSTIEDELNFAQMFGQTQPVTSQPEVSTSTRAKKKAKDKAPAKQNKKSTQQSAPATKTEESSQKPAAEFEPTLFEQQQSNPGPQVHLPENKMPPNAAPVSPPGQQNTEDNEDDYSVAEELAGFIVDDGPTRPDQDDQTSAPGLPAAAPESRSMQPKAIPEQPTNRITGLLASIGRRALPVLFGTEQNKTPETSAANVRQTQPVPTMQQQPTTRLNVTDEPQPANSDFLNQLQQYQKKVPVKPAEPVNHPEKIQNKKLEKNDEDVQQIAVLLQALEKGVFSEKGRAIRELEQKGYSLDELSEISSLRKGELETIKNIHHG